MAENGLPKLRKGVDSWDNFSIRVSTPEGNATIVITEKIPGDIINIHYFVGKQGSPLNAWAAALCEQVVQSIRTKGLWAVLQELKDITSDRVPRDKNGYYSMSGPQALAVALQVYKQLNVDGPRGIDEGYRPPRFSKRDE